MATLILQDGTVLRGNSFGAQGEAMGEIVFNTSMAGYQEILTDPSYANQIITMTYPEMGNYGLNNDDYEALFPRARGFVVKKYCPFDSHYKSNSNLQKYFEKNNIIAIEGIDTRSLTKKIREFGTMTCLLSSYDIDTQDVINKLAQIKEYKPDSEVVKKVGTPETYKYSHSGDIKLALIDYGCKNGIMKSLADRGCDITVFNACADAETILKGGFDAVFLSNGPGNPADCTQEIETIKNLIGKIPMYGICLGYQILSIVMGAKTFKLKYGHRGGNHPVINLLTNKVMVTSQNHGYAVDINSLTKLMTPTYKNLNDETLEGFDAPNLKIYAVQFHPEAAPGPMDAAVIFDDWVQKMREDKKSKTAGAK